MDYVLGLDTSNYTTSVAALGLDGERLADVRQLLPVATGQRGLRQSDALFFHVQHLPPLFAELRRQLPRAARLRAIGASVHPRPHSRSYMPVFRAAASYAEVIAQMSSVPVIRTSHQEGHLQAAIDSLPDAPPSEAFFAVQLSGGTTDFMLARETRFGYHINRIGEGSDLHVGQFVDRVGVALGLPFPAGPHLEQLAEQGAASDPIRIPTAVKGLETSFSGPCSAALRAIATGAHPSAVARAVQICVADSIAKILTYANHTYPNIHLAILAGGVASNAYIRSRVMKQLAKGAPSLSVQFAEPRYASDNAVGVAGIAKRFLLAEGSAGGTWIIATL